MAVWCVVTVLLLADDVTLLCLHIGKTCHQCVLHVKVKPGLRFNVNGYWIQGLGTGFWDSPSRSNDVDSGVAGSGLRFRVTGYGKS